jgi:esterase/lipase superfamily enzyme
MATMMIVSCRKDFWSPTEFAGGDEIRRIDLETKTGTGITQTEFLQELQGKRVTVLVHGYNNEPLDVIDSYKTIDARMRLLGFLGGAATSYDALVGFAWPGGAAGASFPFARLRASESAPRFADLLGSLRSANVTIDLNTHSLGSHVVFEALRDGAPQLVRNAWNFASAVDNESIELGERYFQASRRCRSFYVFHSKEDPVLRIWYRVGDLFDFDTALGYSGPEDPGSIIRNSGNVRVINCKNVVESHGGYRSSGEVWSYISQQLANPSAEQFVTLTKTLRALTAVFRVSGGRQPRVGSRKRGARIRARKRAPR